jgi:PAS fold
VLVVKESAISFFFFSRHPTRNTENHAKMYTQMGQAVPQSVSLVLEGARRKEHKKNAKREANRRSASSSRARKRALMEEMAEINIRLRRQALILSLLPDLVIVIDPEGVISFCSAQVQNILRHSADDLVGARLTDLLVPASKAKLELLVKRLVGSSPDIVPASLQAPPDEQMATSNAQKAAITNGASKKGAKKNKNADANGDKKLAAKPADSTCAAGNVLADSSFPPPEVEFKKKKSGLSDENENSDGSRSKEPSSLTASAEIDNSDNSANSASNKEPLTCAGPVAAAASSNHPTVLPRSPTGSSLGNSGSDEGGSGAEPNNNNKNAPGEKAVGGGGKGGVGPHSSSDTSNTSSLSTTAKKLQKANANLERNVRWHNKKMKTGQTANNATARLSSLQHRSESSSSEEDDSGYRESNDSREETTSSATSDSDETNGKLPFNRFDYTIHDVNDRHSFGLILTESCISLVLP